MAWLWIALSFMFVCLCLLQEATKKKKLPPGPRGIPILGHFHLLGKNPNQDLCHLARKHGPIMYMRFGFVPTVVVSSPAAAELVLKTHDVIFASRPPHQGSKYVSYDQRNISFGPYGPYWRNMRKLCAVELLSSHRINQFQLMREAELGMLVGSLKQAALAGETVDLSARVSSLTADMTCLMVFGRKYKDTDLGEKGFKAVVSDVMELGAAFNLGDYFPYLGVLDLQGLTRRLKAVSKTLDGFLEKIIDDHARNKRENGQARDFVDAMMAIVESGEAEFEFDQRHVKAVLLDMFLGAMDSSATTVEWFISELLRHPTVMKKLQKELETTVGLGHMVEESHLDQLEYLDSVIKETLRLHPPGPLLIPHESMEDCTIDGFHIPKKSRILVNAWAIGRDPNVWPNSETFAPERFVGSPVDITGHDFRLIPFGSGRRRCPGMQLGLTMTRLIAAQLVHCFDWELPKGIGPNELDMSEHFGLVTTRAKHLLAIPNYRLNK